MLRLYYNTITKLKTIFYFINTVSQFNLLNSFLKCDRIFYFHYYIYFQYYIFKYVLFSKTMAFEMIILKKILKKKVKGLGFSGCLLIINEELPIPTKIFSSSLWIFTLFGLYLQGIFINFRLS